MLFPTIVIDNFFENPEMVLEHSKKFEYRFPEDGKYPGTRSENVDTTFFQFTTKKIMASLYPMNYSAPRFNSRNNFYSLFI